MEKKRSMTAADRNGDPAGSGMAVAEILAAGFGWGIIGVFSRALSQAGLSVVQITEVRCIVVTLGMGLLLLCRDRSGFCIRARDLLLFAGIGLCSLVFFNVCYFLTIQSATLAAASILLYTAPFFVLIASAVFFGERITGQKVAALVLAFAGCVLVSGFGGGQMSGFAVLTGIGSGVGYALYSILGSVALKKYAPFTLVFYAFFIAALCLLPFSEPVKIAEAVTGNGVLFAKALALGLISTFLPFVFYTDGLRRIETGKASVLAFSEPMVATLSGIIVFGEELKMQNTLGILLIFGAIVLLNVRAGALFRAFSRS